jgi:hypothetical protein
MLAALWQVSRVYIARGSVLLLTICGWSEALAEEVLRASRPYRDGPLTKADFAGTRPRGAATAAWSEFDYQWKYDYRFEVKNGVHVVRLTALDIWAEFRRDKSWNRRPEDMLLLDHEQGHFDLAQVMALQALLKLSPHDPTNTSIVARDVKLDEATRKLENLINAAMQPFILEAKQAHIDYDKGTDSGGRAAEQALARKAQRERLQELSVEVERLLAK